MTREIPERPREEAAIRDGIAEDDNPIPLWFNVGFYGMLAFGVVYILFYLFSGWSSVGQYEDEVAVANELTAELQASLPSTNPYTGDAAAIAAGSEIYTTTCAVCHKPDGTGMVGPSLVDPYWKYGDDDASLFETVSSGRPGGMPPWGPQLGAEKIWKVLAFLDTLPKSERPGVGAPDFTPPGS